MVRYKRVLLLYPLILGVRTKRHLIYRRAFITVNQEFEKSNMPASGSVAGRRQMGTVKERKGASHGGMAVYVLRPVFKKEGLPSFQPTKVFFEKN